MLEAHCPVHLTEGRVSVFDSVRQLQHLASTLTYNQRIAPNTIWNHDLTKIQFKRSQVEVKALVSGVQSMQSALNEKMHGLSGGKPIKYTIPPNHADDFSSIERGQSWMSIAYTEPREQALMRAMVDGNLWNLSQVNNDGSLSWNKIACGDFMRQVGEIVDLIITLIHMGSGPPLRGEELIRDQIRNGIQPRTLYLAFGQMVAIRRHSKTTNSAGVDPFNVCYFPQSLTDSICYYLLVIRPLETLVARQLYGQDSVREYDQYLYIKNGTRMTSTQFSNTLERLTSKYVGIGFSLQPLRHIMVAFQRAYVGELRVGRGNNIGDLLSSHTTETAEKHYAVEQGKPEGCTASFLLDVQEWCGSYHDAIGLGDRSVPLVPLRDIRGRARRLGSLLSAAASGGPSETIKALRDIINDITEVSYKCAMQDLESFVSRELRIATAEILEYMVQAQQSGPAPPVTSQLAQLKDGITGALGLHNRPAQGPPPRTASDPSSSIAALNAGASRQVKRRLSSGEQPQTKRPSPLVPPPSAPIHPITHASDPVDPDGTTHDHDQDLYTEVANPQRLGQRAQSTYSTGGQTPIDSPAGLSTSAMRAESSTLSRFSPMTNDPPKPPNTVKSKNNKALIATECIGLLKDFDSNCGICHAESEGRVKSKNHTSISHCKTNGFHFKDFYDYNKPEMVRSLSWVSVALPTIQHRVVGRTINLLVPGATVVRYHNKRWGNWGFVIVWLPAPGPTCF